MPTDTLNGFVDCCHRGLAADPRADGTNPTVVYELKAGEIVSGIDGK
jgi:hypothetical protein